MAVIDVLNLDRPVLVGHSIAGEELSSVGSRHPEKVAGLIYLDAGYSYAYDDGLQEQYLANLDDVAIKLQDLKSEKNSPQRRQELFHDVLEKLPILEAELRRRENVLEAEAIIAAAQRHSGVSPPERIASQPSPSAARAIMAATRKYTVISAPILAIYALPHGNMPAGVRNDAAARAAFETLEEATVGTQANAFETGIPSARVVRLPNANHYVFLSHEADVLREMNTFIDASH